jgi:hypothetical protein
MRLAAALSVLALAALAGACGPPPIDRCQLLCGGDDPACPPGHKCDHGFCISEDLPDDTCSAAPDGVADGVPDGVPDGVIDGTADGIPDGTPDAFRDGMADARRDSGTPDARRDAGLVDAPPDAPPADARRDAPFSFDAPRDACTPRDGGAGCF